MSAYSSKIASGSLRGGLTESTVVEVVSAHPTGIAGTDVVNELVNRGYHVTDSRKAVRVSIDKGAIATGPELLLFKVNS
jgi:hypothetical protein